MKAGRSKSKRRLLSSASRLQISCSLPALAASRLPISRRLPAQAASQRPWRTRKDFVHSKVVVRSKESTVFLFYEEFRTGRIWGSQEVAVIVMQCTCRPTFKLSFTGVLSTQWWINMLSQHKSIIMHFADGRQVITITQRVVLGGSTSETAEARAWAWAWATCGMEEGRYRTRGCIRVTARRYRSDKSKR